MTLAGLNPFVRSAGIYEVINNQNECVAYDARLIYNVSGDLTVVTNGDNKVHLSFGNMLYIPAGTRYKIRGQYFMAAIFAFDLTGDFSDSEERIYPTVPEKFDMEKCHAVNIPPFDRVLFSADMDAERERIIHLASIATSEEGLWREVVSAELKLLLLKLCETVSENALPSRMVEALDAYIRENVGDEISNTEIGAIFGYHPFYVSKVLKDKKGITLRQYIISYRLKAAKKLLETTKKSIAEIAEETGFKDASYFTKTFRISLGMTPKEWRNKFKEEFI